MQFKVAQVLHDLVSTYQVNDSEIIFAEGATNINLKNLKT